jgi:hypothetical protein
MERRELLKWIAAVTGCAFAGTSRAAFAATAITAPPAGYSQADIALLDEIADTILPRTSTPGAKDVGVGAFIARYSLQCYSEAELAIVRDGLRTLDALSRSAAGTGFHQAAPRQRTALLTRIDAEARLHAQGQPAQPHYFSLLKQLTLLGYFTSEPGSTKALRYRPVPGKYKGIVPYKKGATSWAWT